MPQYIALPDGGTGEFPDGMPAAEIEGVLSKQFPSAKADTLGPVVGGIADTFGLTNRPGARTIWNPQSTEEQIAQGVAGLAGAGGAIGLGGKLALQAGLPAVVGRIAGGGALGGAQGALNPDSNTLAGAVKNVGAGAVTEGGLSLLGGAAGLKKVSGAAKAFKASGAGVLEAMKSLGPAYQQAAVIIPTLNPTRAMSAQSAAEQISKLTGPAFGLARDELAKALDWVSANVIKTGVKNAGQTLLAFTSDFGGKPVASRTAPSIVAQLADGIQRATASGGVRGAVDTLGQQQPEGTILMGASAPAMAGNMFGGVAGRLMGR